jgi:mannose-6-phosphate isomerase-like protein (cupin superfamily)
MVEPEAGKWASALGFSFRVKIRGEQTSGAFSITEFVAQPGAFTPPHVHEKTDEVFYVLEGELGVMVGEEEFTAVPGACVVEPKGVPHSLWNVGDRPARTLEIATPAGHEAFLEAIAELKSSSSPPTLEERRAMARRHDTRFLPELAPPLMQKYGLRMPA